MSQAVRRRPLEAEAGVRFEDIPPRICTGINVEM
jgi:hypothetical protein